MGEALGVVAVAIAAFAATNIDDMAVLAVFFSRRDLRASHIVAGQYLGIGALVLISLAAAAGARALSTEWTHWLGVLPLLIGLKWLYDLLRSRGDDDDDELEEAAAPVEGRSAVLTVSTVTLANGGDNIGVYTPMFAQTGAASVGLMVGVFALLIAAWCLLAYALTCNRVLREPVARAGRIAAPFVLIVIGVTILAGVPG